MVDLRVLAVPLCDREQDEAYLVHVFGEVDLANVALLEGAMNGAIHKRRTVILACQHLTYIDSTGLKLLVNLHERGLRYVLVAPSPTTLKVRRITGLDTMLPVAASVEEALAALAQKG